MHLHVALGVGTLQLYTVGSAEGGWQYVAAGEPFSVSMKRSNSQPSVLSGETVRIVSGQPLSQICRLSQPTPPIPLP